MVTLYIPIVDLIREGGKVTESGAIMCDRTVPFYMVREMWMCIPGNNQSYGYEEVEKILDYELEDEICTDIARPLTPAAKEMRSHRNLERLLELLCDLPSGPHEGTKADIISRLSEYYGVDWSQTDWNEYEDIYSDAVEFLIIHTPPPMEARTSRDRNLRFSICPWCLSHTPSCLSSCALCFSVFVARARYQRIESRADAPMDIPREAIARAREAADVIPVDDDEPMEEEPQPEVDNGGDAAMGDDDALTIAEHEGEIDIDEEGEGEVGPQQAPEVQSRQPALLFDTDLYVDQELAHFRQGVRIPIFNLMEHAHLIDPSMDYAKYMAYPIIHLMYKYWQAYSKWLELPLETAKQAFAQGERHDALGDWGTLAEVDPETGVSRMVDDDEVLEFGRNREQEDDPTGDHTLGRFRTHQVISQLVRGAIQIGYHRQRFKVENHVREGQSVETKMVHSSCALLLSKLVARVGGYRQYTVLAPRANNIPNYILCIDPFGICQLYTPRDCTIQLLTMMVDLSIPIQAKYTARLTRARQRGPQSLYQGTALQHIPGGSLLPPGQSSILDQAVTSEEAAEANQVYAETKAKAKPKATANANSPGPPREERRRRNQETYDQRWDGYQGGDAGTETYAMGEVLPEHCRLLGVHDWMRT